MMNNNELRPYEEYKSAGLPWLDLIPSHWSISRTKNVMRQNKSLVGLNHYQYKLLSLTLNGIIARDMVNPKGKFPKEFDTYQVVGEKNLVFCLFDIDETPRTVGISPMNGMITGAYTVFKVGDANEKFLYYYYLAIDNNKMLKPLYTGLRKVISSDTFLRTKLPIPPRTEQDQIVKYLDYQLTKINKFIKTKKKLIVVLKEQKQSIINEAVTKGLNPNVKTKPSGIAWLGDVPEHWGVGKIKQLSYRVGDGLHGTPAYDETGQYYFINGNNLGEKSIRIDNKTNKVSEDEYKKYSVDLDGKSILISLNGTIGNLSFYNGEPIILSKSAGFINLRNAINKEFIYYFLQTNPVKEYFELSFSGTTINNLSLETLRNTSILIPPENEQIEIVEYLEIKLSKFNIAISAMSAELELINEYKNSLISDVVTGKVDVRCIVVKNINGIDLEEPDLDEDSLEEEILEIEDGDE